MEIGLISAQTAFEAAKLTLKKIDTQDMEFQNLVVVPDAFSMQAESLIFDTLGIKSSFNIEVVGISRLASKILRDSNIPFQRISALEEVFCLYRAVLELKDQFEYFKNCGVEFCQKILKIIKQFKGCKITPEKIKPTGDENLDKKMGDLRLIYEKYESLLNEKLDLSRLLEFFLQKSEKELSLKKFNLFFINFDSFSAEIGNFIVRLATKVNKTFIGMAQAKKAQKNAFIYEDDIHKKIQAFAKEQKLVVPVEQNLNTLSGVHLDMAENLFGFDIEKKENAFFTNIVAKNKQEEVDFVAKFIKYQIFKGKNFKNFAVAVADEKYYPLIKHTFAKFDIPQYCDEAKDLSQSILGVFLQKILQIAKKDFVLADFEFLTTSPLLGKNEDAFGKIGYFQIDSADEFLERFPQYAEIINSIKKLQKARFLKDFVVSIKKVLEIVKPGFEAILKEIEDERHFQAQSENEQSWELLQQVLEKLCALGGEDEFDIVSFEALFEFALRSVEIETIPTYIDAVFVGHATESYFADVETLFVLGATAGALPAFQADDGIIDDNDIKKLKLNFLLEPEIRVLNRRKRLKLFELLQHAREKLIVGTPMNDDGAHLTRADFVNDLCTLFGKNVIHMPAFEMFDLPFFSEEENFERLLMEIGNRENLMFSYTKLKNKILPGYVGAIRSVLKSDLPIEIKPAILQNHHFPYKKTISPSELETFFVCPFRHFLKYGLALQEKQNVLPNRANFGNFQHELLKIFVSEDFRNYGRNEIDKFLESNFESVAKNHYDAKILSQPQFVKYLKNESRLILSNVVYEQKHSDFRPNLLEKEILYPLGKDLFLKGFVDRVDVFGKHFRILDYKTGKTGSVKSELFYGKKLQLLLYAAAVKEELGLDCAGVYYFNCQTGYSAKGASRKMLRGLTKMDEGIVLATDDRLDEEDARSDIAGIGRKVKPKKGEFPYKDGQWVENFEPLMKYAKDVSNLAISELKTGFVEEKPFQGACKSCPYLSICRHGKLDGKRATLKQKKDEKKVEDEQE